jgi:hypothetical protein
MIVPTYVRSRMDARGLALLTFLAQQVLVYAAAYAAALLIPPLFGLFDWNMTLIHVITALVVFYLLREAVIAVMWSLLARRLEVHVSELNRTVHTNRRIRR